MIVAVTGHPFSRFAPDSIVTTLGPEDEEIIMPDVRIGSTWDLGTVWDGTCLPSTVVPAIGCTVIPISAMSVNRA